MRRSAPLSVAVQATLRRGVPSARRISGWARAATGARGRGAELVVRIVGLAEGKRLNLGWRRKDYATNVLSFPPVASGARHVARVWPRPLGDIVICAPVVAREARAQGKTLEAHWAHLVVHGALHLLGYDHERESEAVRMERRERRVLAVLGLPDPYAVPQGAGVAR
ncbi:MAG: rRNA maturation RNase YbeY [Steroidobacteraceae bacterium]|jgi:probable rRNA maturation factor|nr:rRNA maturation RNase YbeY [Gammaproteobacteria bacterium]